jgi:hypothetical protein
MGGLKSWGIFEDIRDCPGAHVHPGEFVEALLPRTFALIHRIMVEVLSAKGVPTTSLSGVRFGRPLSDSEANGLALLGLDRVIY